MLEQISAILWGPSTMVLLLGTGLYFSVKGGFFQFRGISEGIRVIYGGLTNKEHHKSKSGITPFQALSTALSGTIGNANMAGVATAIAIGGPGSIFWMWVCAVIGMMTKLVEVSLAVRYRVRSGVGYYGGPMYYIEEALGGKGFVGGVFAAVMVCGGLCGAMVVQPHTMAQAVEGSTGIPSAVTVMIAVLLCGIAVIKGISGVGRLCEVITPVMSGMYIAFCLVAILSNVGELPHAFTLIFKGAFSPLPAAGGFMGASVTMALSRGVARGTFSNEAGTGTGAVIHACADAESPIKQGMLAAFEVFFDTIVICTLTALTILTAGETVWQSGENGILLTAMAFSNSFGVMGRHMLTVCVILFAYSSMVGWWMIFESCARYLFKNPSPLLMRMVYLSAPLLAIGRSTEQVWALVDISTALLTIPNVVALICLRKKFFTMLRKEKGRL